jgi:hypothetical protein
LRHDLVDEPELLSFGGADASTRQDHAECLLRSDLTRQALQTDRECRETHSGFGQCETARCPKR